MAPKGNRGASGAALPGMPDLAELAAQIISPPLASPRRPVQAAAPIQSQEDRTVRSPSYTADPELLKEALSKAARGALVPNATHPDIRFSSNVSKMFVPADQELPAVEDENAALTAAQGKHAQLEWWEGPMIQARHPAATICGTFFNDVLDNAFLAKEFVYSPLDPVDRALRLSGLIFQHASQQRLGRSTCDYVFDEGLMKWVDASTHTPLDIDSAQLSDRRDSVPRGIISVVGTLDFRTFVHQPPRPGAKARGGATTKEPDALAALASSLSDNLGSSRDRAAAGAAAGWSSVYPSTGQADAAQVGDASEKRPHILHDKEERSYLRTGYDVKPHDNDDDDEQMIMVIGDPAPEFLDQRECIKFMKHYLSRSIMEAACASGASIVVSGVDDISRQLSLGYQAFVDPSAVKNVKLAHTISRLVGINSIHDVHHVDMRFSHNILLDRDEDCDTSRRSDGTTEDTPRARDVGAERADIRQFKQRLLEALNQGYQQRVVRDATGSEQPPNRDPVPVMLILFGGDEEAREEIHCAVRRGWPFLIVEGSGGYADILSGTIRKLQALSPDESKDDYRSLLSAVDNVTSEAIVNGKYEVISKGCEVERVQRLITSSLKGDEILHFAWKQYSTWRYNEREWSYYHQLHQLSVLLLGIFATLVSVAQTFLILLFSLNSGDSGFTRRWAMDDVQHSEKYWYMLNRVLQWLVIGLPITLSLVLAIFSRMNPWAKLCALRIAASSLLREIYIYRTRCVQYSEQAVRRQRLKYESPLEAAAQGALRANLLLEPSESAPTQAKVDTGSSSSGGTTASGRFTLDAAYTSREELLGIWIRRLQQQLGASEAGQVLLYPPPETSVPPSNITSVGDNGMTDLTPDDFVQFRVRSTKASYERRHAELEGQYVLLQVLIISFGVLGTALAALSAYGLGYLQSWVALCTVVVNSLTRFLDFTRIGAMSELCNTAEQRLADVERWWSSLGTDADSDFNRTKLVTDTENIVQDELDGWSKQMMQASEMEGGLFDDHQDASKEEEKATERLKSLGADLLAEDSIKVAVVDKNGPVATKLRQQILDLNDKLGGFVRPANNMALPTIAEQAQLVEDAAGDAREGVPPDSLPLQVVPPVFRELEVRRHFLCLMTNAFVDCRCLTEFTLRSVLSMLNASTKDVVSRTRSTLALTSIAKTMVLDEYWIRFQSVLRTMREDMLQSFSPEELVSELYHVSVIFGPQLLVMTKESVVQVMDSFRVKEVILLLSRRAFRELMNLCVALFTGSPDEPGFPPGGFGSSSYSDERSGINIVQPRKLIHVLKGICAVEAYERVHVQILAHEGMDDEVELISRAAPLILSQAIPIESDGKENVLGVLHPRFAESWRALSGLQLVENVRLLGEGTAATRCVHSARQLLDILCCDNDSVIRWVFEPSRSEVIVAANSILTQIDINRDTKTNLIRSMQSARAMTKEHADSLSAVADELTLKAVLSLLQARQSSSFTSCAVQHLADSFFLVDYKDLLSGDEMECLVNSIAQLPSCLAVGGMTKSELVQIVPFPSLRKQLDQLDVAQVRTLFHVLLMVIDRSYYDAVWTVSEKRGGRGSLARRRVYAAMHPYAAQRLIFRVLYMSEKEVNELGDCTSVAAILSRIGDGTITRCLLGLCDDPRHETNYAMEISRILEDVFDLTREEARPGRADNRDHSRTSNSVLLRLVHRMRTMQPKAMRGFADLFFRSKSNWDKEPMLSVSMSAMHRLVDLRADEIKLIDGADNQGELVNEAIREVVSLFDLDSCDESDIEEAVGFKGVADFRQQLYHDYRLHPDSPLLTKIRNMVVEFDVFLDLEFSYMVFEEIAQWCTQFDLRDVVVNTTDRQTFAVSWCEFISADPVAPYPPDTFLTALTWVENPETVSFIQSDDELAIVGRPDQAIRYKANLLRALELAAVTSETDPNSTVRFADVALLERTVRELQDVHVVQLCMVVLRFLKRTTAGEIFSEYCVSRRIRAAETSLVVSGVSGTSVTVSLEQLASYILSIARGNRKEVTDAFRGWDVQGFVRARDKEGPLRRLIPNDTIIDAVLKFGAALDDKVQTDRDINSVRWLFIMIQATLDYESRRMADLESIGKATRKTFMDEMNRASQQNGEELAQNIFTQHLATGELYVDDDE